MFWIEESQYIAHEDVNLVVTVHRAGYIDAADTLSKFFFVLFCFFFCFFVFFLVYQSQISINEMINFFQNL